MPAEKFKLPASSYEELTKIIKAYSPFSEPAELGEVSKFIGIDSTVISRNVGFLLELAILNPGQKKCLSSIGRELAQSLEHEMPDEIRSNWREVVKETDFLAKLITAIRIRNGMDEATLQSHIAFSAGQPKKPQFMTGARTVIDILRAAELIKEKDGKVVVAADMAPIRSEEKESSDFSSPEKVSSTAQAISKMVTSATVPSRDSSEIKININISLNCTMADLDTLGEKLNRVVEEVNRGSQLDVDETPDE